MAPTILKYCERSRISNISRNTKNAGKHEIFLDEEKITLQLMVTRAVIIHM